MNELFIMNTFLEQFGHNAYLKSSNTLFVKENKLYSNGRQLAQISDGTLYIELSTQDNTEFNNHREMLVRLAMTFPYEINYLSKLV